MWVFCLYLAGQVLGVWALLLASDEFLGVPGMAEAMLAVPPIWFVVACLGYVPAEGWARLGRAIGALLVATALTMAFLVAAVLLVMLLNFVLGQS